MSFRYPRSRRSCDHQRERIVIGLKRCFQLPELVGLAPPKALLSAETFPARSTVINESCSLKLVSSSSFGLPFLAGRPTEAVSTQHNLGLSTQRCGGGQLAVIVFTNTSVQIVHATQQHSKLSFEISCEAFPAVGDHRGAIQAGIFGLGPRLRAPDKPSRSARRL